MKEEIREAQQQKPLSDDGNCASQQASLKSVLPKKEPDDPKSSSNSEAFVSKPETVTVTDDLQDKQIAGSGINVSNSMQEEKTPSATHEQSEISQGRSSIPMLQFEKVSFNVSVRSEKLLEKLPLRRKLESGVHVSNSEQEGSSTPRLPEKVSEDGYAWRKYGQKLVRGNEFVRSYYKCTYPNCLAKKQVERSHDGPITDVNYLGNHEHPKREHSPQVANDVILPIQSAKQDEPAFPVDEDKSSKHHGTTLQLVEQTKNTQPSDDAAAKDDNVEVSASQQNQMRDDVADGNLSAKRQKRDISNVDGSPACKPNGESRVVVQTRSVVDFINDGYRWRKYGQKLVKGNPNPRSYYRCSNAGCPAKKHVERASHDSKLVITTYEGQHDHEMPPTRTIVHSPTGANMSTGAIKSEPSSKSEGTEAAGLDVVVHVGTN